MPDERVTIRIEGGWATLEEFKSLTAAFPDLTVKDGPIVLYNAIGEGPGRWIELGGAVANIAGVLLMFLKKKPKRPLKPRNLILHLRDGEILILQRPTKREVNDAFKLLDRTTEISLIDPPPEKEPGVIEGFAARRTLKPGDRLE